MHGPSLTIELVSRSQQRARFGPSGCHRRTDLTGDQAGFTACILSHSDAEVPVVVHSLAGTGRLTVPAPGSRDVGGRIPRTWGAYHVFLRNGYSLGRHRQPLLAGGACLCTHLGLNGIDQNSSAYSVQHPYTSCDILHQPCTGVRLGRGHGIWHTTPRSKGAPQCQRSKSIPAGHH